MARLCARGCATVLSERNFICVDAKAGGLGKRQAALRPHRPAAAGAALAVATLLAASAAEAAGRDKTITLTPTSASADHTVVKLGPLALKVRTSSIVLGLAPGDGGPGLDQPGAPRASFAAARQDGVYTVSGSARAALTLSIDLGDFLSDAAGHIPLPLGGVGRQLHAALSLEPGGRLGIDIGSSFGLASTRKSAPDEVGGHFSFSVNALKPSKHVELRWRYAFY
jgi:hypothetical protein